MLKIKLIIKKLVRNLRRPIPDLNRYLHGKIISWIWNFYIGSTGVSFNLSRGTTIEGGQYIRIGDKFSAGHSLWLAAINNYMEYEYTPKIIIGSNVSCSNSVHIAAINSVSILDGVLIGSNVHITDHGHGSYDGEIHDTPFFSPTYRSLGKGFPVVIDKNVWIGDGVVILPGVTIGEGSVIGANSVVSKSLPNFVIAVGAPAKPIKRYDLSTNRWVPIGAAS